MMVMVTMGLVMVKYYGDGDNDHGDDDGVNEHE